jgi:hypothetical protein
MPLTGSVGIRPAAIGVLISYFTSVLAFADVVAPSTDTCPRHHPHAYGASHEQAATGSGRGRFPHALYAARARYLIQPRRHLHREPNRPGKRAQVLQVARGCWLDEVALADRVIVPATAPRV